MPAPSCIGQTKQARSTATACTTRLCIVIGFVCTSACCGAKLFSKGRAQRPQRKEKRGTGPSTQAVSREEEKGHSR